MDKVKMILLKALATIILSVTFIFFIVATGFFIIEAIEFFMYEGGFRVVAEATVFVLVMLGIVYSVIWALRFLFGIKV